MLNQYSSDNIINTITLYIFICFFCACCFSFLFSFFLLALFLVQSQSLQSSKCEIRSLLLIYFGLHTFDVSLVCFYLSRILWAFGLGLHLRLDTEYIYTHTPIPDSPAPSSPSYADQLPKTPINKNCFHWELSVRFVGFDAEASFQQCFWTGFSLTTPPIFFFFVLLSFFSPLSLSLQLLSLSVLFSIFLFFLFLFVRGVFLFSFGSN